MFKFVHTADIHLDSPLKSLALRNPQAAELVGGATRRTFEKIIDLCIEEQVHALIISGDLYDGDLRSMKTAAFLNHQLRRLEKENIRVFMIRGNHDSESSITKHLQFPDNVHVFTGRGSVEELKDLGVAIHGVSFANRHVPESLLSKYKKPIDGLINIGIMHTSLVGSAEHDVYAPCSPGELIAHGFDYWALGHIHRRQVYSESPFIVMPGIPQGRDIGEEGPKSVTFVEASDKSIRIEERFVADAEFKKIEVDFTNIAMWDQAIDVLCKCLEEAQTASRAQHVICRIILVGTSPLYWLLRRDIDLLQGELDETVSRFNKVFIDKIDNQTELVTHSNYNTSDPIDELHTLMLEISKGDIVRGKASSFLDKAIKSLPVGLRDCYGEDQDSKEKVLSRLLSEGTTTVIASLKSKTEKM